MYVRSRFWTALFMRSSLWQRPLREEQRTASTEAMETAAPPARNPRKGSTLRARGAAAAKRSPTRREFPMESSTGAAPAASPAAEAASAEAASASAAAASSSTSSVLGPSVPRDGTASTVLSVTYISTLGILRSWGRRAPRMAAVEGRSSALMRFTTTLLFVAGSESVTSSYSMTTGPQAAGCAGAPAAPASPAAAPASASPSSLRLLAAGSSASIFAWSQAGGSPAVSVTMTRTLPRSMRLRYARPFCRSHATSGLSAKDFGFFTQAVICPTTFVHFGGPARAR
mmetsp:Transcript_82777/g.234791  ORF Transcript_82777/g.234791 Transcript_82777/m.234791 type:complete len:285 (+) Transcript_82777:436-1290(+)